MPYKLSKEAELDLNSIIEYTIKEYGVAQMFKYIDQIEQSAEQLALSYGHYKELRDIHSQLRLKKSGKHYIFGLMQEKAPMIIIAIFYERMELIKRLKNRLE